MKTSVKTYLSILFVAVAVVFSACKGEDGDPGPVGETGTQGEKGDQGDKGDKGDKGEGFDEAAAFGNIVIKLKGNRPGDNLAFEDSVNFKYITMDGPLYSSEVDHSVDGDDYYYFNLARLYSATESWNNWNYTELYFSLTKNSSGQFSVNYTDGLWLYTVIKTSDKKFFAFSDYYGAYFTPESFTSYSYDAATGKLKFKFSFIVPAEGNSTFNELTVTGRGEVTVLERINTAS